MRGDVVCKLVSYAAHFQDDVEIMKAFGWKTDKKSFNWSKLVWKKK